MKNILIVVFVLFTGCIRTTITNEKKPITSMMFNQLNTTMIFDSSYYSFEKGLPDIVFTFENLGQKIQKFNLLNQNLAVITIEGRSFEQVVKIPFRKLTTQSELILRRNEKVSFSFKPEVDKTKLKVSKGLKISVRFPFLNSISALNLVLKKSKD